MQGIRAWESLVGWFVPRAVAGSRTERELARTFVFTHLGGPLIAAPMAIYLYWASVEVDYALLVIAGAIPAFWIMPFVLRFTGNIKTCALLSFQMLAATSLFGAFHYGGFSSPFLPWLVVSMLIGLFYLSKLARAVLALFALNVIVFFGAIFVLGLPDRVPVDQLEVLGWLSLISATIYMTWMALYYARMIGMRGEIEIEVERQRMTAHELEKARALAEETSLARTRFFSKMGHELRTPLNAVIGYSDMIVEDCEAEERGPNGRVRSARRINEAGRQLLALVADVLQASRTGSDDLDLDVSTFLLGPLVDEARAAAADRAEQAGNSVLVTCDDRSGRITSDRAMLLQILTSLLANACKHTTNGHVLVDLSVQPRPHGPQLIATVSDTGAAIRPEDLARLFADFERADAREREDRESDLALCRKLAILLGGDIDVESSAGRGSRFTLVVPAQVQVRDVAATSDRQFAGATA